MKYLMCMLVMAASLAAQGDEDNWRIAADALQREVAEKCMRLLPKEGSSLSDVLARYGKPREMSLPNRSFEIRKLEFEYHIYGDGTIFPITMKVTFIKDRVAESAFTTANLDNRATLISSRGLTRDHDTQHGRFDLLWGAKTHVDRIESEFVRRKIVDGKKEPNKSPEPTRTQTP